MVKSKRKQYRLGEVNFLGRPMIPNRRVNVKFRSYGSKHTSPAFGTFLKIPKPTSVSLFAPSMNRPAAAFWGDKDKDGVYNGLDCAPNNPRKQGPQHVRRLKILRDELDDAKFRVLQEALKNLNRSRYSSNKPDNTAVKDMIKLDKKVSKTQAIVDKDTKFYGAEDFLGGHKTFIERQYGGDLNEARTNVQSLEHWRDEVKKYRRARGEEEVSEDSKKILESKQKLKEEEERFEKIKKEMNQDLDYYKKRRQDIEDRKVRHATRKIFGKIDTDYTDYDDQYWEPQPQKIKGTNFSIPGDSELSIPIKDED